MFCPLCRNEYREGFTRCHDCDVALVESLPSAPRATGVEDTDARPEPEAPADEPLVTVGRYFTPIEAHTHRMALEQAGLPAWVSDERIAATYGVGIGAGLQVRARDQAAALAILDADPLPASEYPPSERREDVVEPTDADAAEPSAPAPAGEEHSTKEGGPPRTLERLELVAVLLFTSAYPILSNLLSEPDRPPTKPVRLMADIVWYAGLTFAVWMLIRRGPGALSPRPLPGSVAQWVREVLDGLTLFLVLWVLHPVLAGLLGDTGVPDASSRWAAFFRQPGVAAPYGLESFFAAAYEEVVFRAYLISRLGILLGKRQAGPVLVAAALFALTHGYPLLSTVTVFVDGVVYGLVYLSSRSLPRLVVAHWIYNLAVMSQYLHAR